MDNIINDSRAHFGIILAPINFLTLNRLDYFAKHSNTATPTIIKAFCSNKGITMPPGWIPSFGNKNDIIRQHSALVNAGVKMNFKFKNAMRFFFKVPA